jgi:hypothetical protein
MFCARVCSAPPALWGVLLFLLPGVTQTALARKRLTQAVFSP